MSTNQIQTWPVYCGKKKLGKNYKNYGKVKQKLVKHGNQKIAIFHLIKGHNSGTTNGIIIKLGDRLKN